MQKLRQCTASTRLYSQLGPGVILCHRAYRSPTAEHRRTRSLMLHTDRSSSEEYDIFSAEEKRPSSLGNPFIKPPSVLLVQHKTRGFSCRKTSKEGHAEKSGVVLYVLAAQLSVRNTGRSEYRGVLGLRSITRQDRSRPIELKLRT